MRDVKLYSSFSVLFFLIKSVYKENKVALSYIYQLKDSFRAGVGN